MTQVTNRLRDPDFQRELFRRINVMILLAWRLGLGRLINAAPEIIGRVMVLNTTGRRSGRIRRFPVTYASFDGGVHCLAGFGKSTHWYRNALAHPDVEVWLPEGRFTGRAEPLDAGQNVDVVRDVLVASGFASKTFEGIDARTVDDEALRALADRFPAVRISITGRAAGRGPADLAWVWIAAAAITLVIRVRRAMNRRPRA